MNRFLVDTNPIRTNPRNTLQACHRISSKRRAKQRGVTLSVVDGIIAATAVHYPMTLVTRNVKEFNKFGIALINPWDDPVGT